MFIICAASFLPGFSSFVHRSCFIPCLTSLVPASPPCLPMHVEPIRWRGEALELLNQRLLPLEVHYVACRDAHEVAVAIRDMIVRGAPAIGVSAAFGIALAAQRGDDVDAAAAALRASRPTATNLAWAPDRMLRARDAGRDTTAQAQ